MNNLPSSIAYNPFDSKLLSFESVSSSVTVINEIYKRGADILYDKYLVDNWSYYEA
jgi:hypothetical protein